MAKAPSSGDQNATTPLGQAAGAAAAVQNGEHENVGPAVAAKWILVLGAVFGFITLLSFLAFVVAAFVYPAQACVAYQYLAPVFALGLGLATAFIGGRAAATGDLKVPGVTNPLVVGLSGGVAVVLIALGIFSFLTPTCQAQTTKVLFKEIPADVSFVVRYPHYSRRSDSNTDLTYDLGILPDINESPSFAVLATRGGRDLCRLTFFVTDDIEAQMSERSADYEFAEIPAPTFELEYSAPLGSLNATKEVPISCAKWHTRPQPIYNLVLISPLEARAAIATRPKKVEGDDDGIGNAPAEVQSILSIVGTALAKGEQVQFAEIKNLLESSEDSIRVAARRYLAKNFESYSSQVIALLQDANAQSDPRMIADLLSALIDGMGHANPSIQPGQGAKPPLPRNLSDSGSLPFVLGLERKIIELTGFPDARVKKQARRLVQRYPYDNFKARYDEIAASYPKCPANEPLSEQAQGELYSMILFYYNRIVDKRYAETLSDDVVAEGHNAATAIIELAKCLPPELSVDAAVVYYGLALVLAEQKNDALRQSARDYTQKFLQHIASREASYYLQGHIDEMNRLAASLQIVN